MATLRHATLMYVLDYHAWHQGLHNDKKFAQMYKQQPIHSYGINIKHPTKINLAVLFPCTNWIHGRSARVSCLTLSLQLCWCNDSWPDVLDCRSSNSNYSRTRIWRNQGTAVCNYLTTRGQHTHPLSLGGSTLTVSHQGAAHSQSPLTVSH